MSITFQTGAKWCRNNAALALGEIASVALGINSNGKRRPRTHVFVFNENGNTMGICPKCRANLKVPVVVTAEFHKDANKEGQ